MLPAYGFLGWVAIGPVHRAAEGLLRDIATLRQKLEADPSEPLILRSEPGVGYRLVA